MEELVLIALIGVAAGFVKGVSGFGSSLVTIPLLTMVYGVERIDEIVVMMITFNVFLNALLLVENKGFKVQSLKNVYLITVAGVIFTIVGLELLQVLNAQIIVYIAAVLIILAAGLKIYNLYVINPLKMKPTKWMQILIGTLSGLGNGIASVDGPPVVFYLTGTNADKTTFKNTLATHFLIIGIMGIIMISISGMYTQAILLNTLYYGLFTTTGLLIGMLISRKLNERTFQKIVVVILVFLAISMFL
jgi:uncharacterized membrane protein YfcA